VRGSLAVAVSLAFHVAAAAWLVVPPRARPIDAADPSPQLAGETFELPAPDTAATPLANASPAPESVAPPAPESEGEAPARPTPPSHGKRAPRASHAARPSAGRAAPADGSPGSTGAAALYGAVGDRSAADLATAFTRAFPQAASGDAAWRSAAFGAAGELTVTLSLDESGHIAHVDVAGAGSPALTAGVQRTMALIKGRPFTAHGKTTKLRLSATVSPDTVHDGLHGDVFAIGGSFSDAEGAAFFALAIGRRVDLRVRSR